MAEKWAIGAVVVVLAIQSAAHAEIIYRDIADIDLQTSPVPGDHTVSATLYLDTNQTTRGLTFTLSWNYEFPGPGYTASQARLTHLSGASTLNSWSSPYVSNAPYPLSAGFLIGTSDQVPPSWNWDSSPSSFNYLATYYYGEGNSFGFWRGNAAYMGFSIPAPGGGLNYGWIGMTAGSFAIHIRDFAFETTPNLPVAAGAIPNPAGTVPFVGAALWFCPRRR